MQHLKPDESSHTLPSTRAARPSYNGYSGIVEIARDQTELLHQARCQSGIDNATREHLQELSSLPRRTK